MSLLKILLLKKVKCKLKLEKRKKNIAFLSSIQVKKHTNSSYSIKF
jgi:hypothetical protein